MKIYLDTCCFNRPFDDFNNDVVEMEAEAVLNIIGRCESGEFELWVSDVLFEEIEAMPDLDRQEKVLLLCRSAMGIITLSREIRIRANELGQAGIKTFDALHLASAEAKGVDVFLSTDRRLLNSARHINIKMKVDNPLVWLLEVLYYGQ